MNSYDDDSGAYIERASDYDFRARSALKMSKVPLLLGCSWLALYGVEFLLYSTVGVNLGGLVTVLLWVVVLASVFLFTFATSIAGEVAQSKVSGRENKRAARKAIDISAGGATLMVFMHIVGVVVFFASLSPG